MNSFEHVFRCGVLGGMLAERLAGQPDCFRYSVRRNVATPLLNDGLPSDARSHLFQDVGDQDSGPSERRLAMADFRIDDDESPDHSLGHRMLLTFRHGECLKTIIAPPIRVHGEFAVKGARLRMASTEGAFVTLAITTLTPIPPLL